VDRTETYWERCRLINTVAPGVLAEEARKRRAVFVHISTDYVFDGHKGAPYVETDAVNPLNACGRSKVESEQAVEAAGGCWLTFRTNWVYSDRRDSFISKVLEWATKNPELRIVDDQIAGPTWARSLAEVTGLLLARGGKDAYDWLSERKGIYHMAG
jgi:dTDP-4-dehydrorhamnose reductase